MSARPGGLPTLHAILWLIPGAQGTVFINSHASTTQIHINTNREKDPHVEDRKIQ